MGNPGENVVEMVTFKTKTGIDEQAFIKDNDAVRQFLLVQPGFMYRSLSKDEANQQWIDIVYWESKEKAEAAGKAFMESECTQAMMQYIDGPTVQMQHLPINWQHYPEMGSCEENAKAS